MTQVSPVLIPIHRDSLVYCCKPTCFIPYWENRESEGRQSVSASHPQMSPSSYQGTSQNLIPPFPSHHLRPLPCQSWFMSSKHG